LEAPVIFPDVCVKVQEKEVVEKFDWIVISVVSPEQMVSMAG